MTLMTSTLNDVSEKCRKAKIEKFDKLKMGVTSSSEETRGDELHVGSSTWSCDYKEKALMFERELCIAPSP